MIFTRVNCIGNHFTLTEHGDGVIIQLVGSEKRIKVNVSLERLSAMWWKWQMRGDMIQDAFKDLSAEHREFIMTGITPDEWDKLFSESEEDEK